MWQADAYDRPLVKQLDHFVEGYAGKILITASAKYSLPASFKTSFNPIAMVDELPVYVGLTGWGYVAEEVGELDRKPASEELEPGWIRAYVIEQPGSREHFRTAQIRNDETYLEYEKLMPRSTRNEAGAFRFMYLIQGERADPCTMAACAPPWLALTRFKTMGLPVRVVNAFLAAGIQTVSDLAGWSIDDLLKIPNFGKKCVTDLRSSITRAVRNGLTSVNAQMDVEKDTDLLASIWRSLNRFTDRERDVIRRRMGLSGLASGAETLQQIADDYGLTRERIRQIESKVTKRLVDEELWDDIFALKVRKLITNREFPLPLLGIEAADPWFRGVSELPDAVEYLLANMCNSGVNVVTIDGSQYLAFVSQDTWEATVREARSLLSSGVGNGWTYSHCRAIVDGLLTEGAREFRGMLWEASSKWCHFTSSDDGESYFNSFGRGAEQVVEAVLYESPESLHYSEIAKRASVRSNKTVDIRRAHAAAASIGILLGRGIYGLKKHIPMTRAELERLSDDAEAIVSGSVADRQWHTSELLAVMVDQGSPEAARATKYILNFALKEFSGLTDLNRMIWMQESLETLSGARIDVHQAVLAVVQQSDRPLRTTEIRQRLTALRGVNTHFQIHARDPLIRVGTALWGINDRDLSLKRSDQAEMLNDLVALLERQGHGIHVSELSLCDLANVTALPPETVCCLAAEDDRLRVSHSQYIYLSHWDSPRRMAISEAVAKVLEEDSAGLTLDEVVARSCIKVGRSCERVTISSCLHIMEAETDSTGLWHLGSSTSNHQNDDVFAEIEETEA